MPPARSALQKTLADFGRREHLSTAWGRIFFQFGPYEHPDRLVPSVIRNLLQDREAPCSHGRQIRSFLHVADVGAAFAAVLDSELEGPVNIGSDERVALADLVERIGTADRPPRPRAARRAAARPRTNRRCSCRMCAACATKRSGGRASRWMRHLSDTIAWWRAHLAPTAPARH